MVKKRVQNAVRGYNLKNDRIISIRLQGKPFSISYPSLCPNTEETEVEWFYEDLQELLELTTKKISFSL